LDIIVVGGGIVGMATAWRLARDGHQVTVLDRAATPGQGTSYANGGQLSYSYVAPLADSAIWTQLPKLLTDAESPVRFRPSRDPFQYRWLLSFLLACNSRAATRTLDRLGALAAVSRSVLHDSPELQALDFSWSKTGKLVVYSSDESFEHAKAQAERQVAQGIDKRPLTVDSCIEIEPALATMAHRLVGGLYSPDDEAGDAHALATGLGELLAAGPTGSRFLGDVDVIGFVRDGARIRAVETSRGRMEADMFVLATGATRGCLDGQSARACRPIPSRGIR
jgi:D-amino-acid dehydrogenase